MNTQEKTKYTSMTMGLVYFLVQVVENVTVRSAKRERTVRHLDIVSNNASFANALSNVEPHQHLGGHKSIPKGILRNKENVYNLTTFYRIRK